MSDITRIDYFNDKGGIFVKREDLACYVDEEHASGAKVRQYMAMCGQAPKGVPLVVGCSAFSCQQVYIADAHLRTGRRGVVFTAKRKDISPATQFCINAGCEMFYVKPGYLSCIRKAAKEFAKVHGCVRWTPQVATDDTRIQAAAYEMKYNRIVIPVGSGAMLVGLLLGLADAFNKPPPVLGVRVSGMADVKSITKAFKKAAKDPNATMPPFELIDHPYPYNRPCLNVRVSNVLLDPWYAAKAKQFMKTEDVLWNTGRRPLSAMAG